MATVKFLIVTIFLSTFIFWTIAEKPEKDGIYRVVVRKYPGKENALENRLEGIEKKKVNFVGNSHYKNLKIDQTVFPYADQKFEKNVAVSFYGEKDDVTGLYPFAVVTSDIEGTIILERHENHEDILSRDANFDRVYWQRYIDLTDICLHETECKKLYY